MDEGDGSVQMELSGVKEIYVGDEHVVDSTVFEEDLKPVFDAALKCGLNLWGTATVYGEGTSERILGNFMKDVSREQVILSTKFTPQIVGNSPEALQEMLDGSMKRRTPI